MYLGAGKHTRAGAYVAVQSKAVGLVGGKTVRRGERFIVDQSLTADAIPHGHSCPYLHGVFFRGESDHV